MIRPDVLLVEDEPALAEMLAYNLGRAGFEVRVAGDAEAALALLAEARPDVLVLDWMLPGASGLELCRQLRRGAGTAMLPIVMLTARAEEADKLRGLETGADDYLTKPFSPRELVARLRAILRRSRPATAAEVLEFHGLRMDLAAHRVSRDGAPLSLGPTEFRLLRHFLERPGRVQSREQILDAVWGPGSDLEPRTVDVHIRRLRQALGGVDPIRTVRGAGYALDRPEPGPG